MTETLHLSRYSSVISFANSTHIGSFLQKDIAIYTQHAQPFTIMCEKGWGGVTWKNVGYRITKTLQFVSIVDLI